MAQTVYHLSGWCKALPDASSPFAMCPSEDHRHSCCWWCISADSGCYAIRTPPQRVLFTLCRRLCLMTHGSGLRRFWTMGQLRA